ncbi:hypothetical protein AB1Y20_015803 [Prymnesium parvum]|uniref:Thioredoxin-like fold domain-containing protein n=1 Tax=Prymnesium parvum TaxID=97485 RepID=A0AB34JYT0_PRYPA
MPLLPRTREAQMAYLSIVACLALSVASMFNLLKELLPPMFAGAPVVVAGMILAKYLDYQPAGKAVGCPADALPGLKFIEGRKEAALGKQNSFQPGRAYAVVFTRADPASHKALRRAETVRQHCKQLEGIHFLVVCLALPEEVKKFKQMVWSNVSLRNGFGLFPSDKDSKSLTLPLASDGDGQAEKNFVDKYDIEALPHAYVIGSDGMIAWHGPLSSNQFIDAITRALEEVENSGVKRD